MLIPGYFLLRLGVAPACPVKTAKGASMLLTRHMSCSLISPGSVSRKSVLSSCPAEGTLNLRTPMGCGRLLALIFMKGLDVIASADVKEKEYWITPEVAEWLG